LLEGTEGKDLPLANINALLASAKGEQLKTYTQIEKDMKFPRK
jgi:hypothetical protein